MVIKCLKVVALRPLLKVSNPKSLWQRLFGRKKRKRKGIPKELAPKVEEAEEMYEGFHWGNKPKRIIRKRASKTPSVAMKLGELSSVTYKTKKGDETAYYEHEFGEEGGKKPDLVADVDNKKLHIVGGDYDINDRGIID